MTDPSPVDAMTTDFRALCAELVDDLEMSDWPSKLKETFRADIARARALLDQPVAEGPTPSDEELNALWNSCGIADEHGHHEGNIFDFARAVLARWGTLTPQPVPVSERMPGQEDCTAEGRCWLRYTNVCNVTQWSLILRSAILDGPYTHWLPANALPTPEAQ